jgi:hypothetical protein
MLSLKQPADQGLWNKVNSINLSLVEDRLRHRYGWDEKRIREAVKGYREFLYVAGRDSRNGISPTLDIDEVWHQHMLHANKYEQDCKKALGQFLHHFPFPESFRRKLANEKGNADCMDTNCQDPAPHSCALNGDSKMSFGNPDMSNFVPGPRFVDIRNEHFLQ